MHVRRAQLLPFLTSLPFHEFLRYFDHDLWFTFLFLPNEDFGKWNSVSGAYFRGILRGFVAQIDYSHPRKVPRKHRPDTRFRFPKSSFGEHKFQRIREKAGLSFCGGEKTQRSCTHSTCTWTPDVWKPIWFQSSRDRTSVPRRCAKQHKVGGVQREAVLPEDGEPRQHCVAVRRGGGDGRNRHVLA